MLIFITATKTLIMKGKAPIDPECTAKLNVAHVFDEGKDIYDCMLNQVSLDNQSFVFKGTALAQFN